MIQTLERVTPLDRMMLGASKRWPQDIGALAILDGQELWEAPGRLRLDAVRQTIEGRLHLVPRFRQVMYRPSRWLGGPLWVDDPDFDLRRHVREYPVPAPGGERELLEVVEQLRRQPLDPGRPLWEMWFLTGLANGQVGMYVRLHHAIADGVAAMTTIAAFVDTEPDAAPASPTAWIPRPWPTRRKLFVDNMRNYLRGLAGAVSVILRPWTGLRRIREVWTPLRRLLTEQPASRTSLSRMVGADRQVRLVRSHLEAVREAGRDQDATINDVLLTITAGGVRTLLESRGEPVDVTTIRIYSPVSLRSRRTAGLPQQGNRISQMAVLVRLGDPNPVRRMREVSSEMARRKAAARLDLAALVRNRLLRRLTVMAAMRLRVNVATADIAGPPTVLYLGGSRVREVYPLLPLIADEPVGVGALSYAGELFFGIVADRDAIPDVDVLATGMRQELHQLGIESEPTLKTLVCESSSEDERNQP